VHSINYILPIFVFHNAASHPIQQVRHTQFYTKGDATNLQFFFTTYIVAVTFCTQPCYLQVRYAWQRSIQKHMHFLLNLLNHEIHYHIEKCAIQVTVISCHSKLHTTYNVEKCTKNKKCNSRYPASHNLPLNWILFIFIFTYLIFYIQVIHIRLENLLDIEIVQMYIIESSNLHNDIENKKVL